MLHQGGDKLSDNDLNTLQKIMTEGKKEFLEKGYKDASLRNIVKQAGVTTGAFYGYYPDKSTLFHALVSAAAEGLREYFIKTHQGFTDLPVEQKISEMYSYTDKPLRYLLNYIYEYFDAFKLIVCCSDGTDYAHYIDSLVEVETKSTQKFIREAKQSGYHINEIKPELLHILSSSYFYGVFEVVIHDMPKEDADEYIADITAFHRAGWDKIFGFIRK